MGQEPKRGVTLFSTMNTQQWICLIYRVLGRDSMLRIYPSLTVCGLDVVYLTAMEGGLSSPEPLSKSYY